MEAVKEKKEGSRRQAVIAAAGLLIFPIVHFYLLEAYTHNGFAEIRPWPQVFNVLLFELAALILYFFSGSVRFALWTEGILAMALGLVNAYVYAFRSMPLVPWDIFSIGTAASVAGNYNFMPTPRMAVVFALFLAVFFAEGWLKAGKLKWKGWQRLLMALALCLGLGMFSASLQQEDFQNRHLMYNKLFTPVYMWQVNGLALTMVMEMPYLAVEKPAGYERGQAKEALEEYEAKGAPASGELPNLIVVMNEAFSDLSVLGEYTASENELPFFRKMLETGKNTVSGFLNVSVCGGNTANTEFEFLTGNTMAFLPQGSIPYQQYVHEEIPALPSYLQSLGYETYASHPFQAEGWDRDQVYPLFGFSHLAFLRDFTDREYIRDFVSDQSCVRQAIQTYESKEPGKPMFLFQVTMQNHGSYGEVREDFTPDVTVENAPSNALSTYLSLLKRTDAALKEMISYFSKEEEPVAVVFFGDHQPNDAVAEPILRLNGMSSQSLTEEETLLRYQVPYLIWANYDIETKRNENLSANYLAIEVLEAAGIPLSPYLAFLKEFKKSYPILSSVRRERSPDASMELLDYQKLQYYQLFDWQQDER